MSDVRHQPVLLAEVVAALGADNLGPQDGAIYVDGTFGAGGYSRAILEAANCTVFAIDRDPDAIAGADALVRQFEGRLHVIEGRFGDMVDLLAARGITAVAGVTLDLGVSSMQLDEAERGFSFRFDGPLDMRMEQAGESAADIVNQMAERPLADLIFTFGEEKKARRVAKAIVAARALAPITTTGRLAEIVRRAVGPAGPDRIDSATRTFQALRIAVNDEMGEIDRGLEAAEKLLAPGGRMAIVSFHSLEDRRVKHFMREHAGRNPKGSRHLPELSETVATLRLIDPQGITASEAEIRANPRARSARLRVAERLMPGSSDEVAA
ncbi:16S rRNA (cytosine(1402)-N(4))-methyltransferase RsmH [Dongia mobilis]|jgi:16S rRNA (cytosine1402-N4)-methyltransferase|uniref:16S rRNA (cytosine(1402)-N(4))-methyltransferase RsmH n=1 Tax=Dongia sp. TaxID=1977262 RepID=UPI0026F1E6A3